MSETKSTQINKSSPFKIHMGPKYACFIGILKLVLASRDLSSEARSFFDRYLPVADTSDLDKWYNGIPREISDEVYAIAGKRNYYAQVKDACPVSPCMSIERLACFTQVLKFAINDLSGSSRDFFKRNPIPTSKGDMVGWCKKIPDEIVEEVFSIGGKLGYFNAA